MSGLVFRDGFTQLDSEWLIDMGKRQTEQTNRVIAHVTRIISADVGSSFFFVHSGIVSSSLQTHWYRIIYICYGGRERKNQKYQHYLAWEYLIQNIMHIQHLVM